jgi:two-component SAPR family response regulator
MLVNGTSAQLLDRLRASNNLFSRVTTTQDAVLDSQLLLKTLDITTQRAQKLKIGGSGFDIEEYIRRVRNILKGQGTVELGRLSKKVKKCCRLPPSIGFMLFIIN